MKLAINRLAVLLTSLLFSIHCGADSSVDHHSKVDGVSLFWLLLSKDSVPSDLFYGDEAKLPSHCNGENRIFIYELGSKGFRCKSTYHGEEIGSIERRYEIEILGIEEKDILSAPHLYQGSQGIYTISRNMIPQKKWEIESLSTIEIMKLRELSRSKYKCPENKKDYPCHLLTGKQFEYQYQQFKNDHEQNVNPNFEPSDVEKLAIKIKGGPIELLITPIGIVGGIVDAAAIVSSVFSKSGVSYKFIGTFRGSLIRVGADIDNDGLPELIIDKSNPGFGQHIDLYKIYPVVDSLMSYGHS